MTDVFMGLLIAVGLLSATAGVVFLSDATIGVGLIALACFAGILARIAQAGWHRSRDRQP